MNEKLITTSYTTSYKACDGGPSKRLGGSYSGMAQDRYPCRRKALRQHPLPALEGQTQHACCICRAHMQAAKQVWY